MAPMLTAEVNPRDGLIDLGLGLPGFSVLPVQTLKEASAHCFNQQNSELLNYGIGTGDDYFREALAGFLSQKYAAAIKRENLILTAGISQAIDLLCTLYTKPGDTIFVEEPSYFLSFKIFQNHGLKIVGIPIEKDGMSLEFLENELSNHTPAFVYTIPTFHNPTGVTMPLEKRRKLIELAETHDFLILADEVYQLLNYSTTPPSPFASLSDSEQIIGLGSFSKILAPGTRTGWIHASQRRVDEFLNTGIISSGGSLNHLMSGIVKSAIELGLQEKYLAYLKQTYKMRMEMMEAFLREKMPDSVSWTTPSGGFFFWLTLPETVDCASHLPLANQLDVNYVPGVRCSSSQGMRNHIRLSISFYDENEILEGLEHFTDLIYRIT
ncbi:MAG: PLP-dependent aminotransferase family protein [Chloroflexota bacterium]